MSVKFHQLTHLSLRKKNQLKKFIHSLFKNEGSELESLDIIFCSDDYLLQINNEHLNHDFYTDIVTFDLSSNKIAPIVGELYISIDRVRDNARSNQVTFTNELHRVIFHGSLHLCGFNDKKKREVVTMRKMEEKYLNLYFK